MTSRLHYNQLKGAFFIILFIVLFFHSAIVDAQSYQFKSENTYKGFFTSFGVRASTLKSNIEVINQSRLMQSGGQIGFIFGNNLLHTKIGLLGYYTSSANTPGTVDLYTSHASVNFYPLAWLSKKSLRVQPYINAGLDYDRFKFFGYYLNTEPGTSNYSNAEASYLGKIKQVNASVGTGFEIKIIDSYDFVHLFTEVRYGHNLSSTTKYTEFSNTGISDQMQVILGVTFGAHR